MEILETIPYYTTPEWPIILFIAAIGIIIIGCAIAKDTELVGLIIAIIGAVALLTSVICINIYRNTEFSHNEYIVKITDVSAREFNEKYEITKYFDYSDAVQVKER